MGFGRLKYYCIIILTLLLYAKDIQSQSELDLDSLISKAGALYSSDQMDSSAFYYNIVAQSEQPQYQLSGISGLIKVAVFRNDFKASDSLIQIGDALSQNLSFNKDVSNYKIMKAEYLKKSSRLLEALALHKENAQESSTLDDKIQYADILLYIALVYEKLSQYDSCMIYADTASVLFKNHMDTTEVRYGTICNSLGVCYYRGNQFPKAKAYYKKAMQIAEDKLGPVSNDLANTLINLSAIYSSELDYHKAIESTERSLSINKALNDPDGMSTNYYSLGIYYYYLGDYGRSRDYLEACIDIREEMYNPYHFRLFWPYQVLGIAIQESGDFASTIFYNNKALEIVKRNYGESSIDEGMLYENMANCYLSMGEIDSSLVYINKSTKILSTSLTREDYALATHYFTLANVYLEADQLDLARKNIKSSIDILKHLSADTSSDFAQNLALLAYIESERSEHLIAEELFKESLAIIQTDSLYNLNANTFWVIGKYITYQYDRYKATRDEQHLLQLNEFAEKYKQLSDDFRKQFIDSYTKSVLIQNNSEVFRQNIGIYNELYATHRDKSFLKAAFENAEYNRTALIRDMLDHNISKFSGVEDSIISKENTLRKNVSELNQSYLEDPDADMVKQDLFQAKEELNKYLETISEQYPNYYKARFDNKIIQLDEVQSKLGEDQTIIEYMYDDTAYYAIILDPESMEMHYVGNRKVLDNQIKSWRHAIESQESNDLNALSYNLYEQLVGSFKSFINGGNLIIVPSGSLYYLNFEALSVSPDRSEFLIRDYNISYALSVNLLFNDQVKSVEPNEGIALAIAPGFEDEIKGKYEEALDSLEFLDEEFLHTVRQPWSVRLAEKLQSEYRNKLYTGLNASESSIKSDIYKGNIIYFGTHAISNPQDPMRSKLVLAKEVGPQSEDGYLHAYEIYGLSLNADLAVLSACESGIGQLKEGEGMISLAYSLNFAGCPSTVMSLWKVDEKTNTWITDAFFDNIAEGMSKSEALRKAKLDFLEQADPIVKHPYFWSGMILMGQDGRVHLKARNALLPYIFTGLILLVVIIGIYLRRKR